MTVYVMFDQVLSNVTRWHNVLFYSAATVRGVTIKFPEFPRKSCI
jgi:hypothetical protein